LETFVTKFTNLKFEPAGLTDDPDVRMAQSIMDYVFRRLALDYIDFDTRSAMSIYSVDERQRYLDTGSYEPVKGDGSTAAELVSDEPTRATGEAAAEIAAESQVTDSEAVAVQIETARPTSGRAHT